MNGSQLFNFIRQGASQNFREVVPEANENNIGEISNILFNDSYSPLLNEYVSNFIGMIGKVLTDKNKSFNNPLAILKKGSMPLGVDIQDIYENPAETEHYELNDTAMAQILKITNPDTKVAYYRRNRKDKYKKDIAREALLASFKSWGDYTNYAQAIITSLYSKAYIDEFNLTKGLVAGAYAENKAKIQVISDVTDADTATAFVKAVKKAYSKLKYPSTEYNGYSLMSGDQKKAETWTNADRIVLLATSDILNDIDVDVLAKAFNIDRASFMGRIIEVDKFDDDGKVKAMVCDESWFQIYDNLFRFEQAYNPECMVWKNILHVWGTFAICPFANAVIFATEAPVYGYDTIDFGTDEVEIEAGDHEGLDMTVTPPSANAEIEYEVTSAPVGGATTDLTLTVSEDYRHVDIKAGDSAEGEYTVTATSGSGADAVTDTLTVTVTASA